MAAANEAMEKELRRLSTCAVVACLCRDRGDRDDVGPEAIKRAFCTELGILEKDIKVSRHRPEDFLIIFEHQHHHDAALDMGRLPVGRINIRIMPWRILPYSDLIDLRHHVCICLEGIPAHAWNESIAKRAIARTCDIDYVDARTRSRDDTRAFCLWAWMYNPSDIPKVTWLTLTGNMLTVQEGAAPPRGRRGLTFKVLVHLDIVESPPDEYGRSSSRKLDWDYGIIDGERGPRERHEPPPPVPRHDRRRDDDDDDDRRGRRHDKRRSWGSRLVRSLSRAPARERERERSESCHGRRNGSSSAAGGHRRHSSESRPPLCGRHHAASLRTPPRHMSAPSETSNYVTPCSSAAVIGAGPASEERGRGTSPIEGQPEIMTPPARKTRGRSRERGSRRRSGGKQRSPTRPAPRQPTPDTPRRCNTRCQSDNEHDNDDCSPSPPTASRPMFQQASASPDPPLSCRSLPQVGAEDMQRPAPSQLNQAPNPQDAAPPASAAPTWANRFKPGYFYSRRRIRGPGHTRWRPSCASPMTATAPVTTSPASDREHNVESATATFLDTISRPLPPALLQLPAARIGRQQGHRRCPPPPVRKSVRIAAKCWPKGDTTERARQVLMKRLGVLEEDGLTPDDQFLRYINLFQGPLNDSAVMALTALCGLDDTMATTTVRE